MTQVMTESGKQVSAAIMNLVKSAASNILNDNSPALKREMVIVNLIYRRGMSVSRSEILSCFWSNKHERVKNEMELNREIDRLIEMGVLTIDKPVMGFFYDVTDWFKAMVEQYKADINQLMPASGDEKCYKAQFEVFGMKVNAYGFRKIYGMLKNFTDYYDDQEGQLSDSVCISIGNRQIGYDEALTFVNEIERDEVFADQ